jgi:hypothetical protein
MTAAATLSEFTVDQLTNARSLAFVQLVGLLAERARQAGGVERLSDDTRVALIAKAFTDRYPRSLHSDLMEKAISGQWTKAAVNAGTTLEPAWAAPLAVFRPLTEAFVDYARPASIIGKLLSLPLASRVPFGVRVPAATAGGTYAWIGEGAPAPVGNMALTSITLPIAKAGGILIVTNELLALDGGPASAMALRRELVRGLSQFLDAQLTDPTVAATTASPASITFAAPSFGSAGPTAANALTDIKRLIETFIASNPDASSIVLLMSPGQATALAIATNAQDLGSDGGRLFGVPVLTGAIGSRIVILDRSALLVADDGGLDVAASQHGSVELDTTPTSPITASSAYVSLWQANMTGLKIDRTISWKMARPSSVLYTNTSYV